MGTKNGLIRKGIGGFYYVESEGQIYECKAKGGFRRDGISPLVGDTVAFALNQCGYNWITEIFPRKNSLIRPPVANIDQLCIVVSSENPAPSTYVIDKLITAACAKDIEPVLVFTKTDLLPAEEIVAIYRSSGFRVLVASGITGEGVGQLREMLAGKITAFTGNSGVGKTTLLNAVDSRLGLETGEVSVKLGRGRHTTRHVELYELPGGGYIADTPGFSSVDLERFEKVLKDDLQYDFPDFAPYLGKCRFTGCTHVKEEGCAVIEAVKQGAVMPSRHASYVRLYEEVKDVKEWEMR